MGSARQAALRRSDLVLKYLARYTHRVAIANSRLLWASENEVAFTYKDYARGQRLQTLRLTPCEFIRRFLLHVPPPGFVRIRRYGLLANAQREIHLACCRQLLSGNPEARAGPCSSVQQPASPLLESPEPSREPICPACGTGRLRSFELPPTRPMRWPRAPPSAPRPA